jgi:hypothetical protein
LAQQLGASDLKIGAAIRAVVETNQKIAMSSLSHQFHRLILDALSTVQHGPRPIVVILDALDECGTADERKDLLAVLANDTNNLPIPIRMIITSRAEMDICDVFESQSHILAYELDITSQANSNDLLSYFRQRMATMRAQKKHLRLGTEWPGEDIFRQLVQKASGLFVWASTAFEFINGYDPRRRLDIILRGDITSSAETALDALYTTALGSAGFWNDEDFVADFREIMGIILVAQRPLSTIAIDALLHLPSDRPSSIHVISPLACVLQHSPTVRVLHPSFVDFFMNRERCGREIWFFNRSTYHQNMAFRCLDRMEAVFKRNMCNLTLSQGAHVTTPSLPEDVSYSCMFWIDHVCIAKENISPIMHRLRDFLFRHLLHWLEATSILRKSRDTMALLDRLMDWILVSHAPIIYVVTQNNSYAIVTCS